MPEIIGLKDGAPDIVNVLMTVAYDGTNYCGWQRQKNAHTVQEALEHACSELYGLDLAVTGASRTDTGVHALAQKALIRLPEAASKIPIDKLPYAINTKLPYDIRVTNAEAVQDRFHPQYMAKSKTYQYKIYNARHPNPLLRNYAEFVPEYLNVNRMREAIGYIVGTHDFKAFCSAGGVTKTTVRTVFSLEIEIDRQRKEYRREPDRLICLTINGSGFLYNMVRIIAGTLIYVGKGKLEPDDLRSIIASKDRTRAGKTAGPQGLTLMDVWYEL